MEALTCLLEISLRTLALAALAGAALSLGRVKSAAARHAVWTMVAAGMLIQPLLQPLLPSIPIRILRAPVAAVPVTMASAGFSVRPEATTIVRVPVLSGLSVAIILVYAGVAMVLVLRLAIGYRRARRMVAGSVVIDDVLVESATVCVPVTVGFLRPRILLPEGWREWPPFKRQAVLAHELAHVGRGDWAIALVVRFNRALYWFHPLGWWLERKLAALAEQACDDAALAAVGDAPEYAGTLLEMARAAGAAQGRLLEEGLAMARESNVKLRIERILDESRSLPRIFGRRGWAALFACAVPVLYLASAARLAPAQSTAADTAPKVAITPAQRWLNTEVPYIITDEEKAAFLRLTTEEERYKFIEQFWLRRDPAPGTSNENQYRAEHYRRIAYANERFASQAAGWQTDRGRIYIVFGPPDEIESHPSGGSYARPAEEGGGVVVTRPFEKWRYRLIAGAGTNVIFTFSDPNGDREYRLIRADGIKGVVPPAAQVRK
jgi:GWxTD domain-containing protein